MKVRSNGKKMNENGSGNDQMVQKSMKIGPRKWLENHPGVVKQRSNIAILSNSNSNLLLLLSSGRRLFTQSVNSLCYESDIDITLMD